MNIVLNDVLAAAAFTGFDESHPLRKSFQWITERVMYDSRKEQRNQILSRPIRHWWLNYDIMDQGARDALIEIFQRAAGRYRSFLYTDREDYQATAITIATDGTTASYQLVQTYYPGETEEWDEDKKDIVPGGTFAPVVTHNNDGAQTEVPAGPGADEYTLDDTTGIMTWSGGNEPSVGILTCTFQFYFRVIFAVDEHVDLQPHPNIWRARGVHIHEVLNC